MVEKIFYRLVLMLFLFNITSQAFAQQKPNIILIMADDMGYGDLGCYGQQQIKTPNIDALAAGGIKFTNYYAGNTVCAPSREALLTGMHTGHTYIRGNFLTDEKEDPALPAEKKTTAEYLKGAGYTTALIGKWGLGGVGKGPETQGFDYSFCYLDQIQAHNYYPSFLFENGKQIDLPENANGRKGIYSHDLFVTKTLDYLDKLKSKQQPFFLYLPYTIPHGQHVVPDNAPYSNKDWPEQMKNYAAMITRLDSDIGRLLQKLKQQGLTDKTLIFFTSDNGANPGFAKFFKSNSIFRGAKTNFYEGGIRVPLIVNWLGKIKPGQVSEHIAANYDFLPTICAITKTSVPNNLDGVSFLPTLLGTKQPEHPYLYWEYFTYNYNWNKPNATQPRNWLDSKAIRMGKWKAIQKDLYNDKQELIELYDLEADPSEANNVAAANPEVVKRIRKIFKNGSIANTPFFPYAQK